MRWELRKILTNRYVLLLLAAALTLNGVLFYNHCTESSAGYTQLQIRQKYEQGIDVAAELEELEQRMWETAADASLITGDVVAEYHLDEAVLERMEEAQGYGQFLREIQAQASARIRSGLSGSAGSGGVRAQERLIALYHGLEGLKPEVSFSGGIEVFDGWCVTDLMVLVFGCSAGLLLLVQERRLGLLMLLRPTRRGHEVLYLRKFGAMTALLLLSFAALYGTNLGISAVVLGLGNLRRPIQSVYGFRACPVPLTVLGYLAYFLGRKLLWAWSGSALFFLLCVRTDRPAVPVLTAAGITGLTLALGSGTNLWLRAASLSRQMDVAGLYQSCLLLNFFGIPVQERLVGLVFSCGVGCGSFTAGLALFCTGRTVPAARRGQGRRTLSHTNLGCHEGYKIWISGGAAALLLLFLAAQWGIYRAFPTRLNEEQQYDRQYSAVLSGRPTDEKEAYLQAEAARFEQIQREIDAVYSQVADEAVAGQAAQSLQRQLRPMAALDRAKEQYEQLQEGQSYVYAAGYERLFGTQGIRDDLRSLALLFLFLSAALSGVFATEEETGVAVLQNTAGATKRVACRKFVWSGLLLVLFLGIAFLPQLMAVRGLYGLDQLGAPAGSLPVFRGVPAWWPIWVLFATTWVIRLLIGAAGVTLVLALSKKTGNTVATLLLSVGFLVLPALIFMLI